MNSTPFPELSEPEITEILDALRAGASVSTPGSRCHSDFGHDAEGWYRMDFDEGATCRSAITEDTVRQQLASTPDIGIALLRQRRWQTVRCAVRDGATAEALAALVEWQARGGDADTARIVVASLHGADTPLDEPTRQALRRRFADGTLLHVYGELHDWPTTSTTAQACLTFIERLMQHLGETPDDRTDLRHRLRQRIGDQGPECVAGSTS